MVYYVIGYIQGNTKWYLCSKEPGGLLTKAVISMELASRFANKSLANYELNSFIKGKKVRGTFVCEVSITQMGLTG
jgi:hypothetical protein